MTEIRSALEIAMAKTQGIKADKNTLKINELKNDGKKLASEYLDPLSEVDEGAVTSKLKSLSDSDRKPFVEGFSSALLSNLTLPSGDAHLDRLKALEKGLQTIVKERKQIANVFRQIEQFFEQYLNARDQVEAALKEQYEPKLREKERLLEQQMGAKVHLTHAQDREFLSLLSKNFSRLDQQYNQALQKAKEQLKQMI